MNLLTTDLRLLLSFFTALAISVAVIPPVVRVSRTKGLVAMPNGRTSHDGAIPTIGGVAIFASVLLSAGCWLPGLYASEFQFITPAMVIIFFFGLKDDIVGINPRKKLVGQIIASLIVIMAADVRLTSLHGLLGFHDIAYVPSVLLTLLIFLAIINSFNLIDGIDGLASGLGIVISLVFGFWLTRLGKPHYAVFAYALAGSLVAFYRFNVYSKKFKLFMGDTGSMLIGFLFAILVLEIICCQVPAGSSLYMKAFPVVAISLMVIPIADTLRVMSLRIIRGKFPFSADRTHCHHDLLRLGFTHRHASTIMVGANLGLFLIALSLKNMPPFALGILMLAIGVIVCQVPAIWLRFVPGKSEQAEVVLH